VLFMLQTSMPDGVYCDIITADVVNGKCTGRTVTVSGGSISVNIPGGMVDDSLIAIHAESKVN
jgi:alpha-amylase